MPYIKSIKIKGVQDKTAKIAWLLYCLKFEMQTSLLIGENMEIKSIEPIKSIKILGRDGCCNCSRMFQDTVDIAAENNLVADIQHVTDLEQVMKYGVMSLPALVINEKVISYGRILSRNDIKKLLNL